MAVLAVVALAVMVGLGMIRLRQKPPRCVRCDCQHPHWLLRPHHETSAVMVGELLGYVVILIFMVLQGSRVGAIIYLGMLWVDGYRLWVHEHGRRRKAARALGRVVTDLHGRLRVVPT